MNAPDPAPDAPADVDLLVVGSGAGGLCAALAAAVRGLRVRVVEKTPWIGGTTALSEGMIWVPCGQAARARGPDSTAAALDYLRAAAGEAFDELRARAYVESAAAMLEFVERHAPVRYELATASPDYYSTLPGATRGLRAYRPLPLDVASRGADWLARLRPPLATTLAFGGMMLSSNDYAQVLALRRSVAAWRHVGALTARYAVDRLRGFPRGARLANGNAVVAGLCIALERHGVRPQTNAGVVELCWDGDRVVGATLADGTAVRARHGVVLATGGFPGDPDWRARFLRRPASPAQHHSLAPASNTGDGLRLALRAGSVLVDRLVEPAAWTPVSLVPQRDGSHIPFPHYVDRAKPGVIAVDPRGRRFCNEASPYIRFVPALERALTTTGGTHAWLIADHRAVRRYGLGAAPPAPGRLGPFVANGYLVRADTLRELAERIGVPPDALLATVARHGEHAAQGVDPEYGRGVSEFDRAYGDAQHAPNPCLGALAQPPFYAVRLYVGDIGTFVGVPVDARARVRRADGSAIAGLYAAGNDVASPTGGEYPAAGVTIGAAMTFGYLAGCDAGTTTSDARRQ